MQPIRVAVIGLGKIAQDQHLPVIARNGDFELAAVVSGRGVEVPGAPTFRTQADMLAAVHDIDAVAICTPPHVRHGIAREALQAGKHVMLEKPPALTVTELQDLAARAAGLGRVLFTTWHSQYNAAVDEAKSRLQGQRIRRLHIAWKEDVRHWHPGQDWIWEVGGFGVFDPGINALSILTKIMPGPIFVAAADLVTPTNRAMPIAAVLRFASPAGTEDAALTAEFDWRQTGPQSWTISVDTEDGQSLVLSEGGAKLAVDGRSVAEAPPAEYADIYQRFATLVRDGKSAVDAAPFQLVADAFMVGRRVTTDAFVD